MKQNSKLLGMAGAIVLAAIMTASGSAKAQTLYLWSGDYRIGLHAGADHALQGFNLKAPTGFTVEKNTPALAQPKGGLYFGMEKDLSGYFAFGFETTIDIQMLSASATIKNAANKSFDYSFTAKGADIYEGIYLAYYLTDELALGGGVGIAENVWWGAKGEASPAEGAPNCQFGDGMVMGVNMGIGANVGVTYYLNESFYVKGNLHYSSAPFYGSSTMSDMMGDDWSSVWGDASSLTVTPNTGARLGLSATIGLKW